MNVNDRIGPYTLLARLAHGGMGEVWEAEGSHGRVALKIIPEFLLGDRALVERLKREAEAIGRLDHPSVVRIEQLGEDGDRVYLAMELLKGETLAERLTRGAPLPMDDVDHIGRELANALAYIHGEGIIHRDLKPQNIFLTEDGRVKLIDLGVAKILDEASLTVTGSHFGTPAYMSPESFRDSKNVTSAADVWSLGVILYEISTGRLPFPGATAASIIAKISDTNVTPTSPTLLRPEIPERTAAIIGQCLERDPDRRAAAEEVAAWGGRESEETAEESRRTTSSTFTNAALALSFFVLSLGAVVAGVANIQRRTATEGSMGFPSDFFTFLRSPTDKSLHFYMIAVFGAFVSYGIYASRSGGRVILKLPFSRQWILHLITAGITIVSIVSITIGLAKPNLRTFVQGAFYLFLFAQMSPAILSGILFRQYGISVGANFIRWDRIESYEWLRNPKGLFLIYHVRKQFIPWPARFRKCQLAVPPERRSQVDRLMRMNIRKPVTARAEEISVIAEMIGAARRAKQFIRDHKKITVISLVLIACVVAGRTLNIAALAIIGVAYLAFRFRKTAAVIFAFLVVVGGIGYYLYSDFKDFDGMYRDWQTRPERGSVVFAVKFSGIGEEDWDRLADRLKLAAAEASPGVNPASVVAANASKEIGYVRVAFFPDTLPVSAGLKKKLDTAVETFRDEIDGLTSISTAVLYGAGARPKWDDWEEEWQMVAEVHYEGISQKQYNDLREAVSRELNAGMKSSVGLGSSWTGLGGGSLLGNGTFSIKKTLPDDRVDLDAARADIQSALDRLRAAHPAAASLVITDAYVREIGKYRSWGNAPDPDDVAMAVRYSGVTDTQHRMLDDMMDTFYSRFRGMGRGGSSASSSHDLLREGHINIRISTGVKHPFDMSTEAAFLADVENFRRRHAPNGEIDAAVFYGERIVFMNRP